MDFCNGELGPDLEFLPIRRDKEFDPPPSVCFLCQIPNNPQETSLLHSFFSEIDKASPFLLRPEILWIARGNSAPPDFSIGIPSTTICSGTDLSDLPFKIRTILKSRHFDLIEIRLLDRRLHRKLQKMKRAVSGGPLDLKSLEPQILPGLYRTLFRHWSFQKDRRWAHIFRNVAGSLLVRSSPPPGRLRILMYHRITDTLETDILAVTPFAFAQQMRWLREEGWSVLPLKEALCRLENGSLPLKAVTLTFDDGYRDNYEEAAPVLLEMGFPATIFPVTAFVLEESEHRRYRGRSPKIPYLTVTQIRDMKKAGFDFGGHTHTHPLLPEIPIESVQDEIRQAKKLLEEWTGEMSTFFAYPNGVYRKEHFRILDALGYEAALSVRPGSNKADTFRYELLRTEISGRDSFEDFIRKMNGGFDLIHRMSQGVRGFYK